MILDLLTVLFFVGGWVLIAIMIWERRRDALYGPYVKREDVPPREEANKADPAQQDALEELSRIVRKIDLEDRP